MNRLIFFISISICVLLPRTGFSQETWSLDKCIGYALGHNLSLKDLTYSKDAGQEQHKQAYRALLPTISANSNYNVRFGRSIDPTTNDVSNVNFFSNNYGVTASMDLFQGFQRLNTISSTKFIYRALDKEAEQEKYLLAFRVIQAFYDVQYFQELLLISQEQVDISQQNSNLVKKQIELGLKAGADLYEANSLLVSDQLEHTQNINSLKAAKLALMQEMNLSDVSNIELENESDLLINPQSDNTASADDIYQKALGFIPIIQAREFRLLSAEKDLAIARGLRMPTLSFFAGYGTSFFETNKNAEGATIPFRTQFRDNTFQFIGFTLDIPILQSGTAYSEIKTRKISLYQAQNDLEIQKQELNNIIQTLVQDYHASRSEFTQTQQQALSRKAAFDIAQRQFEKGLISSLELFTSKNLYASAQNDNLQVKLMIRLQEKTLAFYQGLPFYN